MNNNSSLYNILPPSAPWENLTASLIIGILSFIGLTAYIIVSVAIFKNLSHFKNSFYKFVLSLAVSDSIMLGLFLFYSVPTTILQKPILGQQFDYFLGALCNLVYFCGLMCIINISVNRYWAVCQFSTLDRVYSRRNVRLLLVLNWSVGLLSCIPQLFPCCRLEYSYDGYSWGYDLTLAGNFYYSQYDRVMNSLTFLCIIVCYGAIFWTQKKSSKMINPGSNQNTAAGRAKARREAARKKAEFRLALQSAIMAAVLIMFGLSFTIIPELTGNKWWFLVISVLYIINNSVNPFLYVIFNKSIQKALTCKPVVANHSMLPSLGQNQSSVAPFHMK